jgi:formate dehydrogenase iron-sulfur subunit
VLYLSHVDFDKLGLPDYGEKGVPHVAYSVQEGIYKGFIAPVALYTALGLVMLRNRKKQGDPGEADSGKGVTS